ncbi:uncharacterized protein LOC133186014 [Saccostrea echinata]|uniref:uncharacterized protein LOC133186014 n=1 Tax=Saccostrea echinata TaxID=191078 RepID=UPI002A83305F|nr:uncharacterized protein LOC133186014 [Saccostrea echinata]
MLISAKGFRIISENATVFLRKIRIPLLSLFCLYGNSQMSCPDDTFYNKETGNCTECQPGYIGSKCSIPCRYPNYGHDCQYKCICVQEFCNHIFGCIKDIQKNGESKDSNTIIIVVTVIGIILIIIAFIIISIANRRFFTRHIRQNAHHVGTIMAEHTGNTYNPHLHPSQEYSRPDETCTPTDNGVYVLANTLRYENISVQ